MNPAATQPVGAVQIAAFLKRRLRNVRDWPRSKIVPWIEWFLRHDRTIVLVNEHDRIVGVALGRFVQAAADVKGRTLFDEPSGRVLWVDAIATRHRAALPLLLRLMAIKYGPRELVAGECFSRDGELRMFPMKTLTRFFGGSKP